MPRSRLPRADRSRLALPARYVPYRQAARQPHVVVDGAPLASTVLTLSHWPNNATPAALKRDTSTATVFAYLDSPCGVATARLVTNNHFDEDGLFSMFALCAPRLAQRYRELLIDASRAGDFGVYRRRDAARLCFIIEAYADPARSPLPPEVFSGSEAQRVAALYRHMLPRLPAMLAAPDRYRRWWRCQDEHLARSEDLLANGRVTIEEEPELDLAVVRIPEDIPARTVWRYLRREQAPVHPFAIQSATRAGRLLRLQGRRIEFQYRYESWLQLVSRRPAPRVDLTPFCRWLNRHEAHGRWVWEDTLQIAPRLYFAGPANPGITPSLFLHRLRHYLLTLPPAWDAYHWRD